MKNPSELTLDEAFIQYPRLDTHIGNPDAQYQNDLTATKTKPIKAKHIQLILTDNSVFAKFLLSTLEGVQVLKANAMVCIGIDNDAWQQDQKKLFAKYSVTGVDEHGWMTCEPKPDNEVAVILTDDIKSNYFSLIAQWGDERIWNGKKVYLQYGEKGDYICYNPLDVQDKWIVRKKFFESTYQIKELSAVKA